jgi:outer membrane protein OmpA-like peptidoglycan-associated protein/tetratricopeptide (TPR) repeat protein
MQTFCRYIVLLLLIIQSETISAQKKTADFSDAEYYFAIEDYITALPLYKKLLDNDPVNCNLNYKVGVCLYNIPLKRSEAIDYFERAIIQTSKKYREGSFAEKNAPIDAFFFNARLLQSINKLTEAREMYNRYKDNIDASETDVIDLINNKLKSCDIAEEMFKNKISILSSHFPEPITSDFADYRAVFNKEGTYMVFMSDRKNRPGIFVSTKKDNTWSMPVEITYNLDIDTKYDKFSICSLSDDGKRLYVLIGDEFETKLNVSIYDGKKWGKCQKLNKNINSRFMQTFASESPDGRQLYFTSDRKGGYGGFDIFVSSLDKKNEWGSPVNLGKTINSQFNEETPFISPDNQTLYFSSEGHYNMGGYDIFVSHRLGDNEWSEPQNIGYPLNTTGDNLFFVPSNNPEKSYYCFADETTPHISEIEIIPKPVERIYNLHGLLSFSDNSHFIDSATISITKGPGDSTFNLKPSSDGTYNIQIKPGSYKVLFSAPGYTDDKQQLYIADTSQLTEITLNGTLNPVPVKKEEPITAQITEPATAAIPIPETPKKEEPVVIQNKAITSEETPVPAPPDKEEYLTIHNIIFDYDSYKINHEGKLMLEQIAKIMNKYPSLSLEIKGHTDSKGEIEYNRDLSLKRANAVANYFISKGIDPSRFVTKGLGDEISIAKNTNEDGSDNPDGRRFNRRAEIRVVNPGTIQVITEDISVPENLKLTDSLKYTVSASSSTRALTDEKFTIQLAALKRVVDVSSFANLNNVELHTCSDGLNRYTWGSFSSANEATAALGSVIAKGYYDAFVVSFLKFSDKSNDVSQFTIQLAALKRSVDPASFSNFENVRQYKCKDGINRYCWGNFNSFSEAEKELHSIKVKGYPDAFVVPVSKFENSF